MNTDFEEYRKFNTKLITPLIALSGTAIIALFTYFKRYPVGDWFVIVFLSVVIFIVIGFIVEKMITRFVEINYEKIVAERLEQERLEEEARAAMEAEAESGTESDVDFSIDQELPPEL
ncbi:hypothetical protein [Butyrivibrio proteoclasticus]|uniref:hypothetical protein n=1 Tax=Butyrivibrio proteoclasticus TaxID=43305 RepID=UPI00047D6E10|nr:hypothetical protein [Butyrivibrio proteoclasticus]